MSDGVRKRKLHLFVFAYCFIFPIDLQASKSAKIENEEEEENKNNLITVLSEYSTMKVERLNMNTFCLFTSNIYIIFHL